MDMANDPIDLTGDSSPPKPDFKQQFSQAIRRSRQGVNACTTSDHFKDYNKITAPNPCLALPKHGALSLPLTEREAKHLHRTNANQRAICEIDRKDIDVKNPAFQEWIDREILPAACSGLRLNAENGFEKVSAVLDTFVFYDTARQDQDGTPIERYLQRQAQRDAGVARLVVVLPSACIQRAVPSHIADESSRRLEGAFATKWVAWTKDAERSSLAMESGRVALLTYSLQDNFSRMGLTLPSLNTLMTAWRHGLSTSDRDYPESVGWHLNKTYAPPLITAPENKDVDKPSIHFESLRAEEQGRIRDLLQHCAPTNFAVYLADLDIMEKERVEGSSSCEKELTLLRVTDLDGTEHAQDVPFKEGDMLQAFWVKRRPDDEEHENGWATRHWFETVAVVTPKDRQMKFLCSGKRLNPGPMAAMLENDHSVREFTGLLSTFRGWEIQFVIFPILTAILREFHANPQKYQASASSLRSLFGKSLAIFLVVSVGPQPAGTDESELRKWEKAKETARKVIQKLANSMFENTTTSASTFTSSTGDENVEATIESVDQETVHQPRPLETLLGSDCFQRLLKLALLCEKLSNWREKRKADASEHQSKRTKISVDEDLKADK